MAKSFNNDVPDQALNYIKNNATRQIACSAEPTTFVEANATYALADVALAGGGADIVVANGDVDGRKMTVAQKAGATVDVSGTATHVALVDDANSKLLFVTTMTSQGLTAGNTCTFNSWKFTIRKPT